MAAGQPSTIKYEIEFSPFSGTWVDVTQRVLRPTPITSSGRTSEFGTTQPRTMTLTLTNHDGAFTPGRPSLVDGSTNPYYPNIRPRRRVRYSWVAGSTQYRFTGYVQSWQPGIENGVRPVVTVVAIDRASRLSRVKLDSPVEAILQNATAWWPLGDPSGSSRAASRISGVNDLREGLLYTSGASAFGEVGLNSGEATSYLLTPVDISHGRVLFGSLPGSTIVRTASIWIKTTTLPAAGTIRYALGLDQAFSVGLNSSGFIVCRNGIASVGNITDGKWHHLAVTVTISGSNHLYNLYVDGSLIVSDSWLGTTLTATPTIYVGNGQQDGTVALGAWQGWLAQPALWGRVLAGSEILALYNAGTGWDGEYLDARLQRWLRVAGLTSSDWNLDTSSVILTSQPEAGLTVLDAAQGLGDSEAGGSAVYIAGDGRVRFVNRQFRKGGNPVLTLDAYADLEPDWQPFYDESTLTNSSTGTQANVAGTISTQTAINQASIDEFEVSEDAAFTSYAQAASDVLAVAQWRANENAQPGIRVPKLRFDLVNAANNLYTAFAAVEIGSRIRVTNVPTQGGDRTTMDFFVEGWAETPDVNSYIVEMDVTPADTPAYAQWGTTTPGAYTRWQADGQTLNATITAAATSLAIASPAGKPKLTTTSAHYPLDIKIDQEILTITAAPGASSPQTCTVLRGQQGTQAAPHTAGATVTLWPLLTWAL